MALSVPWADGNWHRHAGQQDTSERARMVNCLSYLQLAVVGAWYQAAPGAAPAVPQGTWQRRQRRGRY